MYTPFVFQECTEEEVTPVCDFGECKNCDSIDECICNGKIDTIKEEIKEEIKEKQEKGTNLINIHTRGQVGLK
jgi:hypothetical protein